MKWERESVEHRHMFGRLLESLVQNALENCEADVVECEVYLKLLK